MPTFEEVLERAKALEIPIAEYEFKKTNKTPIPDPPYIIYMLEEGQDPGNKCFAGIIYRQEPGQSIRREHGKQSFT